jgi:hypothetical protein
MHRRTSYALCCVLSGLATFACFHKANQWSPEELYVDAGSSNDPGRGHGGSTPADASALDAAGRSGSADVPQRTADTASGSAAPDMSPTSAVCGNGIVESGETCDPATSCASSCPARGCTLRKLLGASGTCNSRCEDDRAQTACTNGDDCCPAGCSQLSDADCVPPNVMFTTSTTYSGNLGGLVGADAKCQERARAAGLSGTFIALLSTSQASAFSRIESAKGWVRTDGRPFADGVPEMLQERILYPPRIDEFGKDIVGDDFVVTGTKNDGAPDPGKTGNDWGPAPAAGSWLCGGGQAFAGSDGWYSFGHKECNLSFRLYCFEASRRSTVSVPPPAGGTRIAFVSDVAVELATGISGADAVCSAQAQAARLGGSFKALLATAATSAASRFNLTGPPWSRPDGVQIVTVARDITTRDLLAPITVAADGIQRAGNNAVWTGAISPASLGSATCADWTSRAATDTGHTGNTMFSNSIWFASVPLASTPKACDSRIARIYCLQE